MRDPNLYRINGERVPSVTEILRIAGLNDFSMIDPEVLEKARLRGLYIADYIDEIEQGLILPDEQPEDHKERIAAYRSWKEEVGFHTLSNECLVLSTEFGFAGTFDLYGIPARGKFQGKRCLIDVKASYSLSPTTGVQLAGYQLAMVEQPDVPVDVILALHLQPEGRSKKGYQFKPYDYQQELPVFLAALAITKWKLEHKKAEI